MFYKVSKTRSKMKTSKQSTKRAINRPSWKEEAYLLARKLEASELRVLELREAMKNQQELINFLRNKK